MSTCMSRIVIFSPMFNGLNGQGNDVTLSADLPAPLAGAQTYGMDSMVSLLGTTGDCPTGGRELGGIRELAFS